MKRIIKLNITIITLILIAIMLKTLNARVAYASTNENVEDGVLTPELQWQYIEESLKSRVNHVVHLELDLYQTYMNMKIF